MLLHQAPLLLLGVVLGSFVLGTFSASPSHSLSYFYRRLSEHSQELNQFFIRGYLDDQPIIRFDSLTRKMEPLVPWVEEAEKEMFLPPEWVFRDDLDKLSKLDHHAGGRHTWQVNLGCELREDGSKRGFLHFGYDGMDFISFDQETLRWVTAQPQAKKVKEKWEEDPGWSRGNKDFLEKTCIECLQRYLSYQKEVLQRIEPPVGKVTHKVVDDSLEVLFCQAFGFYPKEIRSTWTRDGEVCQYETLLRNVAPNSDGTYYVLLSIEIDPKERNRFRCYLEHEGLREPLVLALKEETAIIWWISLGIVIAMILILFLICQWWRFRKNIYDYIFSEMAAFPLVYGTKVEIQSQTILQPQVTVEYPVGHGGLRIPSKTLCQNCPLKNRSTRGSQGGNHGLESCQYPYRHRLKQEQQSLEW
ncbi:major histocompatibility complex class I-related gene protein-like isoform X2 [Thamnophis elegans]|uniref:major histocompatibility complex class I-related gene protein-like isoform X2 n=1 Tax=Thamnophis elegans TaxID=35005 RepID=UPI0013778E01|nr:major histocompatibility complex class I-related gene protein-like isoform X2 [Thamnophis elegans]